MIKSCKTLVKEVCEEIRNFTDIAVVGLSGGADSTLVATLCIQALGNKRVYGISMPYNKFDEDTFNTRSAQVAQRLKIHHGVRSISKIADAIDEQIKLDGEELTGVNSGNSRSRARMCVLYGFAHTLSSKYPESRVRVMGTGNLSEDYIGYDTKGGDALADIFILGDLFKSEVYQLLEYFRDEMVLTEELICRTPSAGLEDGQTDEGDLGYRYDDMEVSIKKCQENRRINQSVFRDKENDITKFVWMRHVQNQHKHEAPKVVPLRHLTDWFLD